jgi:regulator of sigma D
MTDIIVPQPDPTFLTTAQLTREIANARELSESKVNGVATMLEGRIKYAVDAMENVRLVADKYTDTAIKDVKEILETRFVGMDRAIDLLQETQNRVPILMDEKLNR